MFVSRADVLLKHLGEQQPRLAEGIAEIADAWGSPSQDDVLARVWPTLTKIAIDHAIAEPVAAAGGIATVPGTFGWDDVGDYASLAALLPEPAAGQPRVLGRPARCEPSTARDSSYRRVAARWWWSGSRTSSSWTRPTPSWCSRPARPSG